MSEVTAGSGLLSKPAGKPFTTARVVLLLLLIGLALMGAGGLHYWRTSPGLVKKLNQPAQQSAMTDANAMIGALMRRIQENPNDTEALGGLGGFFLEHGDWANAETFLSRAAVAAPADPMPAYMLGLAQARQEGRERDAEQNFLRAIDLGGPAEVRLSLGVLYAHFLNEPEKAAPLFRQLVDDPGAPPDVREAALGELNDH